MAAKATTKETASQKRARLAEEKATKIEAKKEETKVVENEDVSPYPSIDLTFDGLLSVDLSQVSSVTYAQSFIRTIAAELDKHPGDNAIKHIMSLFTKHADKLNKKALTSSIIHWKGDNDSRDAYATLVSVANAIEAGNLQDLSALNISASCRGEYSKIGSSISAVYFE